MISSDGLLSLSVLKDGCECAGAGVGRFGFGEGGEE